MTRSPSDQTHSAVDPLPFLLFIACLFGMPLGEVLYDGTWAIPLGSVTAMALVLLVLPGGGVARLAVRPSH